jgi:hypothetical protein
MSTSYYHIAKPISALQMRDDGANCFLEIWIAGFYAGALTMPKEHVGSILRMMYEYTDDFHCALRTHWGGSDRGAIVTVNDETLADEAVIISEYGELLTVAQVKARDGAKRHDGMPTELFGYED